MPRIRIALAALALLAAPQPARALFHIAVINELMTSYDGDPNVQFVEIEMLFGFQTQVSNSVLSIFDATGAFVDEALVVPADIDNDGAGNHWIMGTTALETAAGIQVDFEFPPGLLPESGMVCWGAPGTLPPADPNSWDHTDPASYVDCVAYGSYTGPTNVHIGTATPISPDGHSLQRISETDDNETDFACGDPADPTNNSEQSGSLAATIPCPEPGQLLLLLVGGGVLRAAGAARRSRR